MAWGSLVLENYITAPDLAKSARGHSPPQGEARRRKRRIRNRHHQCACYHRLIAMKTILVPAVALCLTAAAQHLTDIRQLTSGGQNAEAYWSPDGGQLIFQSTRPPHACDQIYIMNADGSDQHMVSTGKGVTTCCYFLPDGKHFVYASTHDAAPECPKRADRSKGYVWDVFPGFDLYLATLDGKIVKRITDAPRYDAEATVNFKTKKIVYTSLTSGDLDLWSMNLHGSGRKQLTRGKGYDGGAVFSRDGRKLVWRAHHPADEAGTKKYQDLLAENLTAPMRMEIFTANADGSGAKQITSFGCASFAPTFTPDGKKILFSSNRHNCDGRKFELFIMNLDGSGVEPVTDFGGFTSFPEFSPDGSKLVFVSDRNAKDRYEFNVFTATWK
jgi:Tol biopolymer transport system component